MSLSKTFNAKVIYTLHSNPPILGLYSETLGYSEIDLRQMKLSEKEVAALENAQEVTGVYKELSTAQEIYAPTPPFTLQWAPQKVTWKPTSIKPKAQ